MWLKSALFKAVADFYSRTQIESVDFFYELMCYLYSEISIDYVGIEISYMYTIIHTKRVSS